MKKASKGDCCQFCGAWHLNLAKAYNSPTMECAKFLRDRCSDLESALETYRDLGNKEGRQMADEVLPRR